ncbi:MAG: head-tail connector protein [Eubacterium sp.]
MTNLVILKGLVGIDNNDTKDDKLLQFYLQMAERKVLNRLYPFDSDKKLIPEKYQYKVFEIAQYLYYRRGSEGETSHSENGVSRSYEDADIPKSMLAEIIPMVGSVK